MQVITLRVEDEAVDKVLELLSRLPKKQVEVINSYSDDVYNSYDVIPIDKLAGCLSQYVTEKVTDEQMEQAVVEGAYRRGMAGSSNSDELLISEKERQHRQDAWNDAVANFALEGIYPSEEMKRIGQLYIDGEITLEQHGELMRKAILDGIA